MNRFRTGIASTFLVLSLLLGGASAAGALGNGLLQLVAIALLLLHFWSAGAPVMPREGRWLVFLFLAFLTVAAAQLIPLPVSVWTALPGRDVMVRSFALLGIAPMPLPASLDPPRTLSSLLWLLPPAAMFLVTTRLTRDERSWVAQVLLAGAIMSIVVGAFQLFSGGASPLYFYEITNANRSTGFFANANHVATLMLCALPFAVLFLARSKKTRRSGGGREGRGFLYAAIAGFIGIGIAMNGSLAAYSLLIPAIVASFFLYRRSIGSAVGARVYGVAGLLTVAIVGLSMFGPLSIARFAAKFDDSNNVGRKISVPTTIDAATDYFPVGSGLGTFRDIYRTYEPIADVTSVYVNHAHNDYAEVALELGAAGILIVMAFILWWGVRTWSVWRSEQDGAALARAGSIAIGIVLTHSLVDYPIRTSAIAVIVAFAAGLMVTPPAAKAARERGRDRKSTVRHIDAEAV